LIKINQNNIIKYRDVEERVREFYKVDDKADIYSQFLEEGDFERYQQYCYMDKDSREYILEKEIVDNLIVEGTDRYKCRVLWIKSRFTEYCGYEWKKLLIEKNELLKQINITTIYE